MNSSKLKTAFREKYGQGMSAYKLSARMEEALRLLQETNYRSRKIWTLVGYKLHTSFITKFREYFGLPPREVQKKK